MYKEVDKYDWHYTCCKNCLRIMSFGDGYETNKGIVGQDYRQHIGRCDYKVRGVIRVGI